MAQITFDDSGSSSWGLKEIGHDLGSYLTEIRSFPEFLPLKLNTFDYQIRNSNLTYLDLKSDGFYQNIFNGVDSTEINFGLLLILSQVNFMIFIFVNLFSKPCITLFKLKFILIYHVASSLQKLQNYCYSQGTLTESSKMYFGEILKAKELKTLGSKKLLRNFLVHYGFSLKNAVQSSNDNFESIVGTHFNGSTFNEIEELIDNQLRRISEVMEKWLDWNTPINRLKPCLSNI